MTTERRDISPKGQAVRRLLGEIIDQLRAPQKYDAASVADVARLLAAAWEEGRLHGEKVAWEDAELEIREALERAEMGP